MVKVIKKSFVVIGKEGSTLDGEGFIQKLWDDANSHFGEVAHLAKKDANGGIVGIWGAMSDISRSFKPWEDGFSKGLYLAGVECVDNAEAPDGWTKWIIPDACCSFHGRTLLSNGFIAAAYLDYITLSVIVEISDFYP